MTYFAGSLYPLVILASPVSPPPSVRPSSRSSGPAARWIAPSTPPPPRRDVFAALTIASTVRVVISATMTFMPRSPRPGPLFLGHRLHGRAAQARGHGDV